MRRLPWLVGAVSVAASAACGTPVDPRGATCGDPERGPDLDGFVDRTEASGVVFAYANNGYQGGGLAVADLDGDDLPDLVAGRRDGGAMVFANRGSLRFEALPDSGVPADLAAHAIAAADLDNDGDRDLVLASASGASVFANDGTARFREVARFTDAGTTEHVLPVDLDGDGLLDLYVGNYDIRSGEKTVNRLYMNRGGLAFAPGVVAGGGLTWTTTAFDVDDDGDQDLYVANDTLLADFGTGELDGIPQHPVDLFLRNDGIDANGVPQLTDIADQLGFTRPRSSMGGVLHDFDDDGRLDLFIPDLGANKVFIRDAAGGFVDRAHELALAATARFNERCVGQPQGYACLKMSWSGAITDFDLDGSDELFVVNGETEIEGDAPPVMLFARGSEVPYRELSPTIACMDARGLAATDLDGDGDQDLAMGYVNGPLAIYENTRKPGPATWLRVVPRGTASNRDARGAVVTVRTTRRTAIRVIGEGGVVHSSLPTEAFVGLGDEVVESIDVAWPSGRRSTLAGPATGTIVIDEP